MLARNDKRLVRTSVVLAVMATVFVAPALAQKKPSGGSASRIAYVSFGPSQSGLPNTYQIWTMSSSGSDKRQITAIPSQHMGPKWSWDGRLISCSRVPYINGQFVHELSSLRIVDPRTGSYYDITNCPRSSWSGYGVSTYALWSAHKVNGTLIPTEQQLLLIEGDSAEGMDSFYVLSPDGTNQVQVTTYPDLSALNQVVNIQNPDWLTDAPTGHARLTYLERWLQLADHFDDLNGNDQWDPGEPILDLNNDGTYTPHQDLGTSRRLVTLDSTNWPSVTVLSNTELPALSGPPAAIPADEVLELCWNQQRTQVAWHDGDQIWLAPVLYDAGGQPGIDFGAATSMTPGTPRGAFGRITFSPEGNRFAFNDVRAANNSVRDNYAINTDGSGLKNLTRSGSSNESFGQEWGPPGSGN